MTLLAHDELVTTLTRNFTVARDIFAKGIRVRILVRQRPKGTFYFNIKSGSTILRSYPFTDADARAKFGGTKYNYWMDLSLPGELNLSPGEYAIELSSTGYTFGETRNLLLRSEDFSSASWTRTQSSVVTNVAIAPNGEFTADKILDNATDASHLVYQTTTTSINSTVWLSVFCKAAERTMVRVESSLFANQASRSSVVVDLLSGDILSLTGASTPQAVVSDADSGWYRIGVRSIRNTTGAQSRLTVLPVTNPTVSAYIGDGASGVYVWGAQVEYDSLTPYQATTSSTNMGSLGSSLSWVRSHEYDEDLSNDNLYVTFANSRYYFTLIEERQRGVRI